MSDYLFWGIACLTVIVLVVVGNKKDRKNDHQRVLQLTEQLALSEVQKEKLAACQEKVVRVKKRLRECQENLETLKKETFSKEYVQELNNKLDEAGKRVDSLASIKKNTEFQIARFESDLAKSQERSNLWKTTLIEKTKGFPTLHQAISDYEKNADEKIAHGLEAKVRPALKAAEAVRQETSRRREAERQLKVTQSIIEYYELIAPFLLDFKDELIDDTEFEQVNADYTDEEKEDEVTYFVTKEEYRTLSIS